VHFRFESRYIEMSTVNKLEMNYCYAAMCRRECSLVETIKNRIIIDYFRHLDETNRKYQILSEISAEHPFSGSHIGFTGKAKRKTFRHFVDNSYAGKVTKAFPGIPSGYGSAARNAKPGVLFYPRLPYKG
jgi:hypothetical protein